jgi:1-acyl-sn-glycerol-3-phosphate acyltransferase
MRRSLATAVTLAEFLAASAAFFPLLGVARLRSRRDPTRRIAGRWMRNFGKVTSYLTPLWDFSVQGEPPADIETHGYVVVSNHESNADPFLLSWLPWDMRWIGKEELFKLPVYGWFLWLGGDIPLRRGDKESVRQMLAECRRTLQGGLSIMMFPEGTRSRDGRLQPFKDGAFQLAIETGAPVLPIAIAGTRGCLPKGSIALGEARAVARVLEPIQTRHLTMADLASLREQARERIARGAAELRRELGVPEPETSVVSTRTNGSGKFAKWGWFGGLV